MIGVDPSIPAAFAEQLKVPAGNVVPLPNSLREEHGALVEPLAVGYHAVRRSGAKAGDAVLILGGGPIGQACYLSLRERGAGPILVSEPNPHRRRLIEALGGRTVDPEGATGLGAAVSNVLGGPVGVVIDAVGTTGSLRTALDVAEHEGTVLLVGMGSPDLNISAFSVSADERSIVGSYCYSAEDFRNTAAWAASSSADLSLLIEDRVTLDEAPDAFARLARGDSTASKVLVFP